MTGLGGLPVSSETVGAGRATPVRPREFRLVVPAGWFHVPLLDAAERHQSVDALVRECFRGVDDQPVLRRQTRSTVSGLAEQAEAVGGVQLSFALNTVVGVPLAAALLVSSVLPTGGADPGRLPGSPDALAGAMRRPGTVVELVDLPSGQAVRRRSLRRQTPSELLGQTDRRHAADRYAADGWDVEREPVLGVTMLEYMVPVPGRAGFLVLSFSSPLEVLAEALVELFDAVAGTLRWSP